MTRGSLAKANSTKETCTLNEFITDVKKEKEEIQNYKPFFLWPWETNKSVEDQKQEKLKAYANLEENIDKYKKSEINLTKFKMFFDEDKKYFSWGLKGVFQAFCPSEQNNTSKELKDMSGIESAENENQKLKI